MQTSEETSPNIAVDVPGISWGAILAGALAAAAVSLILVVLGVGLGFSVLSPWSGQGVSADKLAIPFGSVRTRLRPPLGFAGAHRNCAHSI